MRGWGYLGATALENYMCEAMINSGPRQVRYRAALNHAVEDDRLGHCQSRWHSNAIEFWLVVVGQK